MKKLILFTFFAFIAIKTNAQTATEELISLNGIHQSVAKKMIDHYNTYKAQDVTPTRQSIWIDKTTFKKMVDLLKKDRDNPSDKARLTDGMRIYFASNPGITKGALINSVILIPTRFFITDTTAPSGAQHQDYYSNDKSDPLFVDTIAIRGKVYNKRFYKRGEGLYDSCTNCKDFTCNSKDPHYIERNKAEKMVKNFGNKAMKTTSEWFDLDLLEAFANDQVHDGIRIYFARHDEVEINPRISDLDAFILVPTKPHGVWPFNDHKDYFDCSITNAYFKGKHSFYPGGDGYGGEDNGELCPDNCKP